MASNLKKIIKVVFSRHPLLRHKINLTNKDFHQFFWSKQLMHSKSHLKGNSIEFEVNRYSLFWSTCFLPNFNFTRPIFDFSNFAKSWKTNYLLRTIYITCTTEKHHKLVFSNMIDDHFAKYYHQMKETRCNVRCCYIMALVLSCFLLTKVMLSFFYLKQLLIVSYIW